MKKAGIHIVIFVFLLFGRVVSFAQISPGDLSKAHAHLEGMTNCTKCHVLGEKETSSKCLECHKEIKNLIAQKKGYHAGNEVSGKKCATCHGEHFGRDFQLVRFDENSFDHKQTGYFLEGKHGRIECKDCHKTELIQTKISQKKGFSYLGLGTDCLSCHEDFHQNTLPNKCTNCHDQEKFRPAPLFDHQKTKFPLKGKHQTVDCAKCHKTEIRNDKKFQQFSGIEFSRCTACHEDVHKNKFGNDCLKCHSESSFHEIKSFSTFNHEKTNYPLRGKHVNVDCKKCHKTSFTNKLAHDKCSRCHSDYHEQQFAKNGISPDCSECHSVAGFSPSSFGIEKHNLSEFPLSGGHLATPCFECHKKEEKWNFRVANTCISCHKNIHEKLMDEKYYSNSCQSCHSTEAWNVIAFDHRKTNYELLGKHSQVSCRECHFKKSGDEEMEHQQFKWEPNVCANCHNDVHFGQFDKNGPAHCENCHTNDNWKPEKFDHNTARFKLDGKHEGLACILCHKKTSGLEQNYTRFKFEDISCKSCH